MLDLNKTQSRILKTFVNNYNDYEGEFRHGFTAKMLEKHEIDPKTFRNHKKYLEDNYLIRLNRIEYHGGIKEDKEDQTKKKGQYWYYYKVTKLGLIAYLKWLGDTNIKTEITLTESAFPILVKLMPKIYAKYGKIANNILQNTAEQIKIIPKLEFKVESSHYSKTLVETITLPMADITLEIKREITPPEKIPTDNLKPDVLRVDDFSDRANNEIDDSIEERFTFLYFYNLINSGKDFTEMINVFTLYSTKEYTADEFKEQIILHMDKMANNIPFTIKLIRSNKKLRTIFQNMLKEINGKIENPKILDFLNTSFLS